MTSANTTRFNTVMVIDDNSIDLYITSRIAVTCHFGNKILPYSAAMEAWAYLLANRDNRESWPQVIIVDIYMPMMSGFEFMENYKQLSPAFKAQCRVIVVSSTIDENDILRVGRDRNVAAFREKPLTKQFLEDVVL